MCNHFSLEPPKSPKDQALFNSAQTYIMLNYPVFNWRNKINLSDHKLIGGKSFLFFWWKMGKLGRMCEKLFWTLEESTSGFTLMLIGILDFGLDVGPSDFSSYPVANKKTTNKALGKILNLTLFWSKIENEGLLLDFYQNWCYQTIRLHLHRIKRVQCTFES